MSASSISANVEESIQVADRIEPDSGSFRDRHSHVAYIDGMVVRLLDARATEEWRTFSKTKLFKRGQEHGLLVRTTEFAEPMSNLTSNTRWVSALVHERIPFISYPYEWSFGMLKDAALLQLQLLLDALAENLILKDSTPYNIQWHGSKAEFIDLGSFERLKPGQVWVGYRQFCELFLYPLFLQAYRDIPFQPFLRGDLEGLSPVVCNRILTGFDKFRPGVFKHVYLHSKLESAWSDTNRQVGTELKRAGFQKELIVANVKGLKRLVEGLSWKRATSQWSDYAETCVSYSDEDFSAKRSFIEKVLADRRYPQTWDLGCNTGTFSRIASEVSDYVLSIDSDHLAIEHLYQALKREDRRNILPLVMNLASTSPGLGWRGRERKRMSERKHPDLVLALALVHHLVLTANIPLDQFVGWLSDLTTDLIVEFVDRSDPMVEKLLRNKEDQYIDYTRENFERLLSKSFIVQARLELPSKNRVLYFLGRN